MTKFELIDKVAVDAGISKVAAKTALGSVLDGIKSGLKKKNSRVTLIGFGTFKTTYRKTRMGRNPPKPLPKPKNVVPGTTRAKKTSSEGK